MPPGRKSTDPVVRAGAARSSAEIVSYIGSAALCPACGNDGMVLDAVELAPAGAEVVAEAKAHCPMCFARSRHLFTAGPGWETPPPDGDPRLATGEAPSTLLPERVFRRWADDALRALDNIDAADTAELEVYGQLGLQGLLELEKLRRAEGRDLDADDEEKMRRAARAFVAGGAALPSELARRGPA
jgi:hypothetical protein